MISEGLPWSRIEFPASAPIPSQAPATVPQGDMIAALRAGIVDGNDVKVSYNTDTGKRERGKVK